MPECSCKRCLEVMLRRFSPDVFAGEITVTRQRPVPREEPGGHREAA